MTTAPQGLRAGSGAPLTAGSLPFDNRALAETTELMSTDFEDDPLNGPGTAGPSAADSMADPLNGGPTNWGTTQAMEDNAYLYDEQVVQVGPMALLEGAMGVIKAKPGHLLLIGLLSGGVWYGTNAAVGPGLAEICEPIVGDKVAAGVSQFFVMLLVWSAGLLMQGPLLGVAFDAKLNQSGLISKYTKRAFDQFKTLAGVAALNLVVAIAAMAAFFAIAYVMGFVAGAVGGILGGLIGILGAVGAMFVAIGIMMRFYIAAPAVLAERLPAISAMKRSAELTQGTALAMAFALALPIFLWIVATIFLGFFGLLNVGWISIAWTLGFFVFYFMLSLAFVPAAYLVYRHMVDGLRADQVADD